MSKVICLGKTFNNEDERREYFRNELRKKLPELKKIEGFPIGEDEDIIALSDPPYYTACPNPWLNDFIEEWEEQKDNIPGRKKDFKVDEPYASDISEGKNNPIYTAHSYHTKVPHPAIMRYILHYTQPGDIVFDGFAGTGMTGVASRFCGSPTNEDKFKIEDDYRKISNVKPNWGLRKTICGDLSTLASFISYNYNTSSNISEFHDLLNELIIRINNEYSWIYETVHSNGKKGIINYIVWSDVYICNNCNAEIVFWNSAVDHENGVVNEEFKCQTCNKIQTKRTVSDAIHTVYSSHKNKTYTTKKRIPVLINYTFNDRRYIKSPDELDIRIQKRIDDLLIANWFPLNDIIDGDEIGRLKTDLVNDISELFPKRTLIVLSELAKHSDISNRVNLLITASLQNCSWLYRWRANGKGGTTSGTYYICATPQENNVFNQLERKLKDLTVALGLLQTEMKDCAVFTNSSTKLNLKSNSIDYIFTDPPFGANIMYSELNYMWEVWLKVITNNNKEAVECRTQGKSVLDYQNLMLDCFKELKRVLKPDKWMTVEFSNTSAAVWNGIQTALQRAGFIIADIAALDKQQGSFKAVTTPTAVKQDLIISCYKPSEEFENKFKVEKNEVVIEDFITDHFQHLPIQIKNSEKRTAVVERSPKILYDRLVTFYLMRGLPIPIDAVDFQTILRQKFVERDGMFFTHEQATLYDELYENRKGEQFQIVFDSIYSESDAVLWLRERLQKKAQTYQDIMPDFRKANRVNRKGELVAELKTVLEENFIQESNGKWRVPNMNEAKDREALRNKSLIKEFDRYKEELENPKTKKIKEVRVEALRAGFKMCWEKKDFKTIVNLGDKIPQNILLEDEQLLMYYDIAKDRI